MTTKDEKEHMRKVAELGCIICFNNGHYDTPCELHHINARAMGLRSDNYSVIGLCHTHHRTGGYGVAVHAGKKAFESSYGTEEELLEQVRGML